MPVLLGKLRGFGRALLVGVLRLLLPLSGDEVPVDPKTVHSVLVIRTDDRVGNLLLTTPLLAALREGLPHARLGLLCAARRAPAIEGTGLYDELWPFEKRDFFVRPWRFVAFCLRLRRARYEVAIEAGHWHAFSFTAGALALWSGARVRVGHRRGESARLLTHAVAKDPAVTYDPESKLELLRPLGLAPTARPPLATRLGEASRRRFEELFARRPVLLVNPGGRKADHRWSADAFAAAARAVAAKLALDVWIAWGPGEEAIACEVEALTPGARRLPPTNLEELAGALRAAALVITNDTGPMHLSVAVGTPTLAVVLTGDWRRWAEPGPRLGAVPVQGLSESEAAAKIAEAGAALLEAGRGSAAASHA
ncbi:MAG TPA: glycosyltransferase family 9 protein [Myxococcales bacterium]|nr:glycosyltransferase family 9 protein [Myxococcales bacterium]